MKKINNFKFDGYRVVFVFLLLLTFAVSYVWLGRTSMPPYGSHMFSILEGMHVYNAWHNHSLSFSVPSYLIHPMYPSLEPLCYSLYFLVFGKHTGKELLISTLFLIITLISINGLGEVLFNKRVALFATAIFLSFYGVFKFSKLVYTEFALMGMVSLSIYSLLLTDYFSNRRNSIVFGIILGLTALIKWSFLAYICGPLVIVLGSYFLRFAKAGLLRIRLFINLFISIATALVITLPWYISNFYFVTGRFHVEKINLSLKNLLFTKENLPVSQGNLSYYLTFFRKEYFHALVDSNYSIIFLSVVVFYILAYVIKIFIYKKYYFPSLKKALILSSWMLIPLIILCLPVFTQIRNPSHVLSILPPFAIIISAGIMSIPLSVIRRALIIFVAAIALPFWNINLLLPFKNISSKELVPVKLNISFNKHEIKDTPPLTFWKAIHSYIPINIKLDRNPAICLQTSFFLPDVRHPPYREILNFISADYGSDIKALKVLFLGNDNLFLFFPFEYYNLQNKKQMSIFDPVRNQSYFSSNLAGMKAAIFDSPFDYIIYKDQKFNLDIMEHAVPFDFIHSIESKKDEFNRKYKKIKQFTWPDDPHPVEIYKRVGL